MEVRKISKTNNINKEKNQEKRKEKSGPNLT